MTRETPDTEPEQQFTIHAVEADIVMNKFGLHVPSGAMYVLDDHVEEINQLREAIRTYHSAVERPYQPAENIITEAETDEQVSDIQDSVSDAIAEYDGDESEISHDDEDDGSEISLDDLPDEYRDAVTAVYGEAIDRLHQIVDGSYDETTDLKATFDDAFAEYVESVPPALNGDLGILDDAYAMIEDKQKDPSILQPLVIRANEGDTIKVEFKNELDRHASIHQTSLPYDVTTSDGMAVGRNPDTTAAPGESITYRWQADSRGTHFFYDGANQAYDSARTRPQQSNLLARGLFGAVVVEPEGARWSDPQDHGELRSGVRAVIHLDDDEGEVDFGDDDEVDFGDDYELDYGADDDDDYDVELDDEVEFDDDDDEYTTYREFVMFYHSPIGAKPDVTWPGSDTEQSLHAINYRCDPSGQRVNDECVDCNSEKFFYHSWTNGDPGGGDNVYTAYKGEPIKFCFVGASHEENHVHHLHQHRTKEMPRNDAETVDAQTIGLGDTHEDYLVAGHGPGSIRPDMDFTEAFRTAGAGYVHGTAGDILFHCHLFPHYAEGMWGMMRVLDKEHEFLEPLPETEIESDPDPDDLPLESGEIIDQDADAPGFPEFVGEAIKLADGVDDPKGHAAPKPPKLSLDNSREVAEAEEIALRDEPLPGAPYADPVVEDPDRIVTYTITITQTEIAYNDAGEFDPDGVAYVLDSVNIEPGPDRCEDDVVGVTDGAVEINDAEWVRSGAMNPEPLFLRANVGDCVRVRLQNDLDVITAGDHVERWDTSIHPHYVGYDVLASDSLPNGFNYYQADSPNETIESRWFADEEGTIYFHDHIFAIMEGVHGMFCGFMVEPRGSEWRDPYSGDPVYSGAQANIIPPDGEPFREQALHYHDFAPLRKPNGEFVNPEREHVVNKGAMAINYRNAPYYNRGSGPDPTAGSDTDDSAYVHSSAVHGDPPTPVVEAYDGDPIRFRVFQGAYEEQHTFSVHGLRTKREPELIEESVSKYLGTSEAFTFEIPGAETERSGYEIENPDGLPVRDYLYGSNVVDDLWTGMWGLVRLWGGDVAHLRPLGDCNPPAECLDEEDLREMGHPAPHSTLDWTEFGQRATQLHEIGEPATHRVEEESPLDSTVHLPDSVSLETVDTNKRRHGVYRTVIVPPDIAARRNENVGTKPPTPDANGERSTHPGPDDAPWREYDVTAIETEIPYNDYGDHDPHGVVFALDQYADEIAAGKRDPEPLFVRVNAGERLRLNLTNDLPLDVDNDHPHPEMVIQREWERSNRISLHPLALRYDVNQSDGATVGFNYDTTVGPGETRTYEWYAEDDEVSTVCLWDMADIRSTRHHGAFGQVLVEPEGAVPLSSETTELAPGRSSAIVKTPDGAVDFREHGLLFADAQYILNRDISQNCVVPRPDDPRARTTESACTRVPEDTEDQGYGGINYRSEPFDRRFETTPAQHLVYDSTVHGDPNTPLVAATVGDPVRFRVACAGDKARAITFHLAGHPWQRFRNKNESPVLGVNGQFGPGAARTLSSAGTDDETEDASDCITAGGPTESAGDYIYQETKQRRRLESGMWGLFRVHEDEQAAANADASAIQPLPDCADRIALTDRPHFVVEAATDFTGSGDCDTVVGVPDSDLGAVAGGGLYLFTDTALEDVTDLSSADLQVLSETAGDRIGNIIESRDRPCQDGMDLVTESASGRVVIPGGDELCAVIDRAQNDQQPKSSLATFVQAAMPPGDWPVVPLVLVAEPLSGAESL